MKNLMQRPVLKIFCWCSVDTRSNSVDAPFKFCWCSVDGLSMFCWYSVVLERVMTVAVAAAAGSKSFWLLAYDCSGCWSAAAESLNKGAVANAIIIIIIISQQQHSSSSSSSRRRRRIITIAHVPMHRNGF